MTCKLAQKASPNNRKDFHERVTVNKPTVTLISHTTDPERTVATAARLCYSAKEISEVSSSLSEEKIQHLIEHLASRGHYSPFEHANFTFGISNISRTASHQLVRHRIASYSQQSLRYTASEGKIFLPDVPECESDLASQLMKTACAENFAIYEKLIDAGVARETARYILPNAITSNIIVTMNARELLGFFKLRCCMRAQKEIRDIAYQMLRLCRQVTPNIFEFAGPSCVQGECPEGDHKPIECRGGKHNDK